MPVHSVTHWHSEARCGGFKLGTVKALFAALLFGVILSGPAQAQPRTFSQAELEALLAPIALYPDALVSDVLVAATYPDDVPEAAAWLRAQPQLQGEAAVRAADPMPWHPSLKALLAYPELLERMAESPQWTDDLGDAYLSQQVQVMATVHALRQRAQAQQPATPVLVQPVVESHVVYLPYYDPLVVYGSWLHAHRPIFWRPWHRRSLHHVRPPVHHVRPPVHHVRPPVHVKRPPQVKPGNHVHNHYFQAQQARPIVQGARIDRDRSRIVRERPRSDRPSIARDGTRVFADRPRGERGRSSAPRHDRRR